MIWLVDDQHLGRVLRGDPGRAIVGPGDRLGTTGCWYVRLCHAVLGADERTGTLSRPFALLPDDTRQRALGAVLALPETIELASLRDLAPVIGRLRRRHSLNILGMEALAASVHLDAGVVLSTSSPRLQTSLEREHRPFVVGP